MSDEKAGDPVRCDLEGVLDGFHILVDLDALDVGLLEDLEANQVTKILDALERIIVDGNLPHGVDRAGLRRLKPSQLAEMVKTLPRLFNIPNPS